MSAEEILRKISEMTEEPEHISPLGALTLIFEIRRMVLNYFENQRRS